MDSKVMIIVAAVVIVVAGAGGAYVLLNNNNNSNSSTDSVTLDDYAGYYALVFGNADGDTDIDADDVALINEIIAGSKSFKDYKLADANRDGSVTSKDAELVQDIIDGKATTVDVIDCYGKIVTTPYPIKSMFFFGQVNARVAINVLDLQDQMVGFATNATIYGASIDKQVIDKIGHDYSGASTKLETEGGTITRVSNSATDSDFTNLSKLDFQVAVIEDSGMSGYSSSEAQAKFKDFGAVPLIMNFDNTVYSLQTVATLGVLVKNTASAASYVSLMKGVLGTIEENISTLSDDKKATCLSVVMTNSVSGTSSDYYAATVTAGGKQISDWVDSTKKFDPSNGDTWLYEKKYNADYIIHFKSQDFDVTEAANIKTAKTYAEYFSETYTFQNQGYYLINGVIPLPARLAYMAEIMYPEQIASGYGAKVFQEFIDKYTGQTIDVNDYKLYWNVSQLIDYKAPTTVTLSAESVELGLSATTDITMTTNGTVYYPSITSSNPSVCAVTFNVNGDNTGGTFTLKAGTAAGTSTITVDTGSVVKTIEVSVSDIKATDISLSSGSVTLGLGASATLTYSMTPSNASVNDFSLTSSDTSVVSIGDGYITGLKAGIATITVKVGTVEDTCTVTVSDIPATGLTLLTSSNKATTMMSASREVGYEVALTLTVTASNANVADLKVTSSNTDVLTVKCGPVLNGVAEVIITKASMVSTATVVDVTATLGELTSTVKCTVK